LRGLFGELQPVDGKLQEINFLRKAIATACVLLSAPIFNWT
jgi:hypothetical protein